MACLSLAQEFYPNLKSDFFLYTFDYLAARFEKFFGYLTDPDQRLRALNTFLYQKGYWNDSIAFEYDSHDVQGLKRDNRFINGYLARKKGTCVTMPMLYLILAERLQMPMYAVRAPNHFFLRYLPQNVSLNWEANVEATSGGGFSSDEDYTIDMKIPKEGIRSGMYLRTLRKKEYLASLLLLNVAEYIELKDLSKAQHYAELAMHYDSTLATAVWANGLVHYKHAICLQEQMASEIDGELSLDDFTSHRVGNAQKPSKANTSLPLYISGSADGNVRKLAAGLSPEPKAFGQAKQAMVPTLHLSEQNLTSMSPNLVTEIRAIEDRYLPTIKEEMAVWDRCKCRAKEMGMAFCSQTKFFRKQSLQLKSFQSKGDK